MRKKPAPDYDSPWKEALERYFRSFLALCFPRIEAEIDWSRGVVFRDKELQRVVRDADQGRGHVDKLAQVWRSSGEEAWILVHVEVQADAQPEFGERMCRYNFRLTDRYGMLVVSLGVLADDSPNWRPNSYWQEAWGYRAGIEFPTTKLLDFAPEREMLERSANPFAVIVLAHLDALATRNRADQRREAKLQLVKALYRRGLDKTDILELFRLIDWLMVLPPEAEERFREAMDEFEEEQQMPYITSVERIGIRKGIEQGIEQGIAQGMQRLLLVSVDTKFGSIPEEIVAAIQQIDDPEQLSTLQQRLMVAGSLGEFRNALQAIRS